MKRLLFVAAILTLLLCRCLNARAQTQVVANGTSTTAVTLSGTGCFYYWVNNNADIGLPFSGVGNIPAFKAVNTGSTNAYATVTVRPVTSPLAYMPNVAQSQINIINTDDNQTLQTIQLGSTPKNMAFSPDGTKMYVTGINKMYVISLVSQTVIDSVNTGAVIGGLVVSPDGSRVYMGVGGAGILAGVVIVNTATNADGHIFTKPGHINFDYDASVYIHTPGQLAITPDGKKLYVAVAVDTIVPPPDIILPRNGYVAVIKTFDASIITRIQQKSTPFGMIINKDGSKLYTTSGINQVMITNTTTDNKIDSITVGKVPTGLVFSPDGSTLYVTNASANTLSVVNVATKQIQTVNITGLDISTLSITPDGKKLYVFNQSSSKIIRVLTDSFSTTTVSSGSNDPSRWFGNFIKVSGYGCSGTIVNYIIRPTPTIPTIITAGTPGVLTTNAGTASASTSFTVTGYKLTQGILVSLPVGFEVSTDNVTFSSSLTIGFGGDIPETKVYVRIPASAAAGNYGGIVTLSSSPANNQAVKISGSVSPAGSVFPNYTLYNGQTTPVLKFPGNGCFYKWTTSTHQGEGSGQQINPFIATNTSSSGPVTTTYSVSLQGVPYNQTMAFIVNQLSGDIWFYDLYNTGGDAANNFKPGSNGYLYSITGGGGLPQGIAFSADQHQVYITNKSGNSVSVYHIFETASNPPNVFYDVQSTPAVNIDLGLGTGPRGIAISADGNTLYVANSTAGTMSVISTVTNTVTATINSLGLNPAGVAISPDGSRVYVAVSGSGNVAVINTADNTVITTVPVGANPQGLVVSADGSKVYVSNQGSNTVSVINTANNTAGAPITVGSQPTAMGITPDGSKVYVANQGDGTVSVINTAGSNVAATVNIGTGKAPSGIGISPDGALVYVYDNNSNIVTIINSADNSVKGTFTEGGSGPAVLGNFIEGPTGCALPFTFTITVFPTSPIVNVSGYLAALTTTQGVASAVTGFNVSGLSLLEGILVTPPPGFEVSLDSLNFSPTVTLGSAGNVPSTRIYVRLAATNAAGTYSGDILATSKFATTGIEPTAPSTVTPPVPTILPGTVSGKILACTGTPSASPFIQQVKISTVALAGILSASATSDFELSLSPTGGFAQNIDINVLPAKPDVLIYIRSSATAKGRVAANMRLSSPGAEAKFVYIYGVAAIYPTINPVASQTAVAGGAPTKPVTFTGTGANTYNWFNDNSLTGLDPSGTGDIAAFKALNNTNSAIIATIKAYPVSIPLAYVANQGANAVSVINVATNTQIAYVTVGSSPRALVLNEDATRAYIANFGTDDISVLNTATNTIIATVKVSESPVNLELSADGSQVLVCSVNGKGTFVSAVNTADNTLVYIKPSPNIYTPGTVRSPDGSKAYVYSYGGFIFSVYDVATNKMITAVGANNSPGGLALSPDGSIIYVADGNAGTLMVIDANDYHKIQTISLGANSFPRGVSISLDGKTLYVANGNNNSISIIDAASYEIINTLNTGNFPLASVTTGGTGCSGDPATFTITVEPVPPIILATGVLDSLGTIQGNPSPSTKFNVSGTRMKEGIKATAPAGFEVSIDNINFANTVTFGTAGTIATTAVYVRIAASTAVGNYHGDIILTSLGAANDTVATYKSNNVTEPVSSVVAGYVTGNISACAGSPSASPSVKQFTASGYLLSGNITVRAPKDFEISLNANSGFTTTLTLVPQNTVIGNTTMLAVPNTIIYVRSAATALGIISGTVDVSSPQATTRHAPVSGVVNIIPTVNKVADQAVYGGQATNAVAFTGTGNTYSWINDNTKTGLAAAGSGDIPSFTGINTGGIPAVSNVTVTPIAAALAYIANSGSGTISVINTGSGAVVGAPIKVGSVPYGIAISPDGRQVYAVNQGGSSISVIDAVGNITIKTISLGGGKQPTGIVISPDGTRLYTANNFTNTVSIVDIASGTYSDVAVGNGPNGIIISPDGSTVYVTCRIAPVATAIYAINTTTNAITKFATGRGPFGLAISPNGTELYESNYNDNTVWAINTATGFTDAKITVGTNPAGIAVSLDGKTIYVANGGSGSVSVINATSYSVATTLKVGTNPQGVSLSPDGALVYVANAGSASVSVIKTANNTVSAPIVVGNTPISFGNFISAGTVCSGATTTFKITVNPSSPYITVTGTLTALTTIYGTPSASTSISVSGVSTTTGIAVTPPTGFEVSLDNKNFNSTVAFGAAGTIAPTAVYIRLAATTPAATYAGNITLSSAGATDIPVAMPGSTVNPTPLTITANDKTKPAGRDNPVLTASYTGFVNQETSRALTKQPVLSTTATISSPVGQYPIEVSGAASNNYTFTYVPGILTVNLGEQQISIPNAFTPNGDGINDTWQITALATYKDFTVAIFNRLGQSLYYSNNYPIPWDGTYNGSPLPMGVYYYIINIKGASKPFAGDVAIIR